VIFLFILELAKLRNEVWFWAYERLVSGKGHGYSSTRKRLKSCILLKASSSNALHIQFISSYIQRCSIKSETKEQGTSKAMAKDHKIEHL